ncbi:MAG: glycosyltransferase [Moorea sp. SIO1G6]|uniref:Glycosyltransferase n=2 Tax=Moorena TaxID=1155738 RepID=F4XP06_9CYAN|nr:MULTISPECIES: TIGR04282 family arsenosugar biosynthesis glycosyltransferase [unclassified Moorena]EGJ33777.1 hypothetical protein LYNGBM3L_25660 [Moorena producens 3L]NEP32884.1 glycosyltransferase [Moorena sp. SIO3B2]NEP69495.1 glycosyltransferase [Moorena sp. SIO3A5]NER88211.1 glycosyltransferase [Moorena sp. SIO3A2]NES41789.1 glycosyltransferase [Moorena sp. SIO2C4]
MILTERLIIFSRYPEPGKTKTRMIPALGADGAAKLQRRMTEHTVAQVKEFTTGRPVSVEIHFAGGNQQLMENWLGSNLVYKPQSDGDLGKRITTAFQLSFAESMTKVVIIGIDCPDLNSSVMNQAFEALDNHDLVLGAAKDGGYYLVGLSRLIPELFVGVNWGTSEVLQQTVDIANSLNLTIGMLSELTDVDRPEDLWVVSNLMGVGNRE